MAEPIKISTSKYTKQGKVDIDGHIWTVKLPGAGTELRLSQAFRGSKLWAARIGNLDKKIDAYSDAQLDFEQKKISKKDLDKLQVTDEELDRYEEYSKKYEENEKIVFDFFSTMFEDGTEDNSEVKKWIEETPTAIIEAAFEDIKKGAENKEPEEKPEESDGQEKPSEKA